MTTRLRVGDAGRRIATKGELIAALVRREAVEQQNGKRPRIVHCAWCKKLSAVKPGRGGKVKQFCSPKCCAESGRAKWKSIADAKAVERAKKVRLSVLNRGARLPELVGPIEVADWLDWIRLLREERETP